MGNTTFSEKTIQRKHPEACGLLPTSTFYYFNPHHPPSIPITAQDPMVQMFYKKFWRFSVVSNTTSQKLYMYVLVVNYSIRFLPKKNSIYSLL